MKCVVGRSTEEVMSPLLESIDIFTEMVVLYETYKIPITFAKYAQVNHNQNYLLNIDLLVTIRFKSTILKYW